MLVPSEMLRLLENRLAREKIARGFQTLSRVDKVKSQKVVIRRLGDHARVKMDDQWDF